MQAKPKWEKYEYPTNAEKARSECPQGRKARPKAIAGAE